MRTVRVRFSKSGRAKYISHLDLNRCMQRAVRRAGLPVWYTQGFNPHPHIVFALPLSIFFESGCEAMDIRLEDGMEDAEIARRLAAQMPEGIEIGRVSEPVMPVSAIAFAGYRLSLDFDGSGADRLRQAAESLAGRESILVEKTTKHRQVEIELRDYWRRAEIGFSDGSMIIRAVLPASQQENINPASLVAAMEQYAGLRPDFEQITRTGLFDAGMRPFE